MSGELERCRRTGNPGAYDKGTVISGLESAAASDDVQIFHAGTARNVTPDEATLKGTLRSFTQATRTLLHQRVEEAIVHAARACRCEAEVTIHHGYPATVNEANAVEKVRQTAAGVFGAEQVIETDPMAPAEDFSYFLQQRPGAFVLVGAGNAERGITAPHHSPEFDVDESVLPRGSELLAGLALA